MPFENDDDVEAVDEALMALNGADSGIDDLQEASSLSPTNPPSGGSSDAFSRLPSPNQGEMDHEGEKEDQSSDTSQLQS